MLGKKNLSIIKSQCIFFVSVKVVFSTLCLNLRRSRYFDPFSCQIFFILVILYKKLRKNLILSRHILLFLEIIIQLSLRFISHIKQKHLYIIKILLSLVFCNYVILGGHILNIYKTVFLKLIFHQQLRNQLTDALFQEFHKHSAYVIKLCI